MSGFIVGLRLEIVVVINWLLLIQEWRLLIVFLIHFDQYCAQDISRALNANSQQNQQIYMPSLLLAIFTKRKQAGNILSDFIVSKHLYMNLIYPHFLFKFIISPIIYPLYNYSNNHLFSQSDHNVFLYFDFMSCRKLQINQQLTMEAKGNKRCKRHGCLKHYNQQQNSDEACKYHPGQPIFHDLKKGWTCCNKIVYDWDQFQKLPTCAVGRHTDVKEEAQGFYKSNTVKNASEALKKQEAKIVVKDINEYNKELEKKKKEEEATKAKEGKKEFVTKEGKFRCINQGCRKDYLQHENSETACNYHKGQPVFHDLKKFWTCCGKETHDWDEFMKLPTCCVGWHSPKQA